MPHDTELLAAGWGAWPGEDPRQGASVAFSELAAGYPPVPYPSTLAVGGTRWACDLLGFAVTLCEGLPVDLTSYGWRLAKGTGRDESRARSRRARAIEAAEEYGAGFDGRMMLTVPGPWTLVRNLSTPDGNRVLGDSGARRDVIQSYAFGLAEYMSALERALGQAPRIMVVERALDPILTGTVPTVSGYRSLPALPDQFVTVALGSFLKRAGDDPLLALPALGSVTIAGKRIPHLQLAREAGASGVVVPLPGADPRRWETLAEAADTGAEVWLSLPGSAGEQPDQVKRWVDTIREPWLGTGMSSVSLAKLGIVAGYVFPTDIPPLLPQEATDTNARGGYALAARLSEALKEIE